VLLLRLEKNGWRSAAHKNIQHIWLRFFSVFA